MRFFLKITSSALQAELREADCLPDSWQRGAGSLPGATDKYNVEDPERGKDLAEVLELLGRQRETETKEKV